MYTGKTSLESAKPGREFRRYSTAFALCHSVAGRTSNTFQIILNLGCKDFPKLMHAQVPLPSHYGNEFSHTVFVVFDSCTLDEFGAFIHDRTHRVHQWKVFTGRLENYDIITLFSIKNAISSRQ
ncbi:hypothetical protein M758_12G043500 [Ceratodon purpureus]|nr:hypothetical protein M758_12G043500 [Ceratodon purpureus]